MRRTVLLKEVLVLMEIFIILLRDECPGHHLQSKDDRESTLMSSCPAHDNTATDNNIDIGTLLMFQLRWMPANFK